jgi:5-methyltetrahydrofolate--homocysteine methyltransferase
VGVVLGCNNYEVVDLGVMVPTLKILEEAKKHNVDIIGLSGLITPSLEEMVHVATEMQRQGFTVPLLIGGATTSEMHTAVKIAPAYDHPVIHVRDASRATSVVASLLSADNRERYAAEVADRYSALRTKHENTKAGVTYLPLEKARENRFHAEAASYSPHVPAKTGLQHLEGFPLETLRKYIDWTFFFHAWKMSGKYPQIFDDPLKGTEARKLFDDANRLLDRIIAEKMVTANGAYGIFPAYATGDSIILKAGDREHTLHFLRNQEEKEAGIPNLSLADFILPRSEEKTDYIGLFAVTAGLGIEPHVKEYEALHDDYNAIMIKILADRLAEAFAEVLHLQVRREFWGYAADENLSVEDILHEQYTGIRPAPGYPACPEHSEKKLLFEILDAEKAGITLTESYAMYPGASVCGYYFAHPEARYFNIGRIGRDQAEDYASRKGISPEKAESLLSQNLNYQ